VRKNDVKKFILFVFENLNEVNKKTNSFFIPKTDFKQQIMTSIIPQYPGYIWRQLPEGGP